MEENTKDMQTILKKLKERVKELNTLYRISKITINKEASLEELLQRIVDVIPSGWQYPEICCSKINIGPIVVTSPRFRGGLWNQKENIVVHNKLVGGIEVHYLTNKLEADEGPFLLEERKLLIEIAKRISELVNTKNSETPLQKCLEQYDMIFNQGSDAVLIFEYEDTKFLDKVVVANDKMCSTLHYSKKEINGLLVKDILPPDTIVYLNKTQPACTALKIQLTTKEGETITMSGYQHVIKLNDRCYLMLVTYHTSI